MCQSERTRHWSFSITWSSIVFTWIKCATRNLFGIGFFVIHEVVSLFHKWNEDKTEIVGTNKNFLYLFSLDLHTRGMQVRVSIENNKDKKKQKLIVFSFEFTYSRVAGILLIENNKDLGTWKKIVL